jgi:hypothetical protein
MALAGVWAEQRYEIPVILAINFRYVIAELKDAY